MLKFLRAQYLIPTVFAIGMAQYGVAAVHNILNGNVIMWTMDSDIMESAGPLRYVKDAFLLALSCIWPLYVARRKSSARTKNLFKWYLFWLATVTMTGTFGIAVGYSPPLFLVAGFRWLMLLHASVGIFFLMRSISPSPSQQAHVLWVLMAMALIDAFVILLQLKSGARITDIQLASSRLTGMFSHAAVAAFFGLSLSLCGMCLTQTSLRQRAALTFVCLFIAFASGTRSTMIILSVISMMQLNSMLLQSRARRYRLIILCGTTLLFIFSGWIGYQAMIDSVGRGGIMEAQLGKGGRISNFISMLGTLYAADYGELLIGRGIGVGTNTAYSMLENAGVEPRIYRFNQLIDNSFMTQFFQFGLVGSLFFWGGIASFFFATGRRLANPHRIHHRLSCGFFCFLLIAGNVLEFYFLMVGFAIAIGLSFWQGTETQDAARHGAKP